MAESSDRALLPDETAYVTAARDKAFVLYEGVRTPHRSCGIALAETFGLATPAYQALRRGGNRHGDFAGPARKAFCTNLAAEVAAQTAEALCRSGPARPAIIPFEGP